MADEEEGLTPEQALVEKARKLLKDHQDIESDNIQRAGEAIDFRSGEQWPQAIKQDREEPNQDGGSRPCPVMDKTNQYVRQIVNEERQSKAAIKIRPVDDVADPKVAEVFNGIIRHIEDASQAIEAYTTAGEHAIDGGFGYFRILTQYEDPMSFDQDIRIKRIPNRFSVALGPHVEQDGSDLEEGLIWEDMPEKDFKQKWPKAKLDSFDEADSWKSKDTVRVAEYMYLDKNIVKIHMLEDGSVVTADKLGKQKSIDSRETSINTVKWAKVTGSEVLEEADMLGTYIPIIKVIGNELTMPDGKTRLSGAIESAMDPQRLHNYAHAGFIESVALAPRAPWLAEESQIEGFEQDYADANRRNITLLKYKATIDETGQPIPPPQRTPPAGMSTGWDRMIDRTNQSVEAAFGMYGPSVGAQSQEKSGIALQEQKAQGMVGNFHFPDNLSRSIQHGGRILLQWIPGVYDTERIARMLGEDGDQEMAYLNPEQEQAVAPRMDEMGQEIGSIYNLNVGKYDVTVTTGPSYTAKRQEALENQMQVVNARPELLSIIGDIMFKNMDAPGSDDIAERLKTLLPPEIQQMEANKDQTPIDPRVQMAMQQIEQQAAMLEERGMALQQAEQELNAKAQEIGGDKAQIDASTAKLTAAQKVFNADVKTARANLELFGRDLIDKLEDITDPIAQQLANQPEVEIEVEGEEGTETTMQTDPAVTQALEGVGVLTAQATTQLAKSVADALDRLSESLSAPRETILQRDAEGNAVGSTSTQI
jgi:hypothetical protein